jgi:UDP-N-acetylglucosamine--N-acetylmuramyl-(pentapeptide) pyrophosphoryl-undecaprenol N-acetylglucosamine transferase
MANFIGVPTLIQEQNSFPGKTNKILSNKVNSICTAYDGLEKYFPIEKIKMTGNPVRSEMITIEGKKNEGIEYYQLDPNKKTILVIGGSLGAKTLNESIKNKLTLLQENNIQIIWQCGKFYFETLKKELEKTNLEGIKLVEFISRMDLAYAVADLIISRAGAISISELCLIKKSTILVPSPNVAEDHQTKNAMALVDKNAAVLIKDNEARDLLISKAIEVINNTNQQTTLISEISKLGKPDATASIVNEIEKII